MCRNKSLLQTGLNCEHHIILLEPPKQLHKNAAPPLFPSAAYGAGYL